MLFAVIYLIDCVDLKFKIAEKLSETFVASFNY